MSKEVKRYDPLAGLARNAKLRRMEMQCDPQWVLDLLAERDRMLTVMKEARQVIAIALRANAPDWYATDEEINQHMTIKKLDAALQGEQK